MAAFSLRALGRLGEALEPMRVGAKMRLNQGDWKNAAVGYGNPSELQPTLGRVAAAVVDAGRSVDQADRSGDAGGPSAVPVVRSLDEVKRNPGPGASIELPGIRCASSGLLGCH